MRFFILFSFLMSMVLIGCNVSKNNPENKSNTDKQSSVLCNTDLLNMCSLQDEDYLSVSKKIDRQATCTENKDVPKPLFKESINQWHPDYLLVHEYCQRLNPVSNTFERNDIALKPLKMKMLSTLLTRPAVLKVMAQFGLSKQQALQELEETWFAGNAFEHVFCGEQNHEGTIGGMHLWSEYYLAESNKKANYKCTVEGMNDPVVATIRYDFSFDQLPEAIEKPIGGFMLNMSPACLLGLGFAAYKACQPSTGMKKPIQSKLYGEEVDWIYWKRSDGTLLTIFPLARVRNE